MEPRKTKGLLSDCKVLEFAGLGPAPFGAMLLAGMGARIVRIERPDERQRPNDIMGRGRAVLTLDLKNSDGRAIAFELASGADVLVEGYRPGVMERLGLSPEAVMKDNPALVYARMTGWGQTGPLSGTAGHDINFLALTGALGAIGPEVGPPTIPLNLIGDYGGGGMLLAFGIVTAVLGARQSGQGSVIDCAICDGVMAMLSQFHSLAAAKRWGARGTNHLDGGAHYYNVYRSADGLYLAVGAAEPKFYAIFRERAGLNDPLFDRQFDRDLWPRLKQMTQSIIATRSRAEWLSIFDGHDACVTPVLSIAEALEHPHFATRKSIVKIGGVPQAAPVPKMQNDMEECNRRRKIATFEEAIRHWGPA